MFHIAGGHFRIGAASPEDIRPAGTGDGAARILVGHEPRAIDPLGFSAFGRIYRLLRFHVDQPGRRTDAAVGGEETAPG